MLLEQANPPACRDRAEGENSKMTGPRPDRRHWTPSEDKQLLEMFEAGLNAPEVARKLKRPVGAVRSRKHRRTVDDKGLKAKK